MEGDIVDIFVTESELGEDIDASVVVGVPDAVFGQGIEAACAAVGAAEEAGEVAVVVPEAQAGAAALPEEVCLGEVD